MYVAPSSVRNPCIKNSSKFRVFKILHSGDKAQLFRLSHLNFCCLSEESRSSLDGSGEVSMTVNTFLKFTSRVILPNEMDVIMQILTKGYFLL